MAPIMLPTPPSMTTRSTRRPPWAAAVDTAKIGAIRPPARPASAQPTATASRNILSEFTPISEATSMLNDTARIARPMRVFCRKTCSSTMITMLIAMTTTLSFETETPATWMMPGNRDGMPRVSVPNSIRATCPRIIIRPKPAMMLVRNCDSENWILRNTRR